MTTTYVVGTEEMTYEEFIAKISEKFRVLVGSTSPTCPMCKTGDQWMCPGLAEVPSTSWNRSMSGVSPIIPLICSSCGYIAKKAQTTHLFTFLSSSEHFGQASSPVSISLHSLSPSTASASFFFVVARPPANPSINRTNRTRASNAPNTIRSSISASLAVPDRCRRISGGHVAA